MEKEVSKDFIWAILNESLLRGNKNLRVKSDLLGTRILEFDLASSEITSICSEQELDRVVSRKRLEIGDRSLASEIPDYLDLRDALWSSLVLPPENLGKLMGELKELEKRKKHPYRYPKERLFAMDTNIAYLRLFSRLTLLKGSERLEGYDAAEVPIIVLGLVEDEISNGVNKKLGSHDIQLLSEAVGSEAKKMVNCLCKRGRKALNAQSEIRAIREQYSTRGLQGGEFLADKEARDEEMAKTLSEYMSTQKVEIVFLTNDDKARAHTYAYRIPAIELKYPHHFEGPISCDHWLITELLYDLVITFGFLSLEGLGVRLLGTWSGKDANDYLDQRLRVEVEQGASISSELELSYQILNDLQSRYDLDDIR